MKGRAGWASLLLAAGLPASFVVGCGGRASERPYANLVLVCIDTLRADHLGMYGARPTPSPRLDGFAEDAIVFENAHTNASWTLPSFASLFTSLYSSTHGCWTFDNTLNEGFETLPEVFQAAGFRTHGVASHVFFNEAYGLQQGFDTFDDELAKKRTDPGWKPFTSVDVTDKAVGWLEEHARERPGEPFVLLAHYFDPHIPYFHHGGGGASAQASELEAYKSEIRFTDAHVGRLLDALGRLGMEEDTVVCFFSDHGEAFYEHPGIRRHSYSLYTEETRIPLVLRVPGMPARRVKDAVRMVDVRPTLLELFGLRSQQPRVGVSLTAAMRGEAFRSPPLLGEIRLKDDHHTNALTKGSWKLIENVDRGTFELYDVEKDPGEQRDVAEANPDVVRELAEELATRVKVAERYGAMFASGERVEVPADMKQHLKDLGYASDE